MREVAAGAEGSGAATVEETESIWRRLCSASALTKGGVRRMLVGGETVALGMVNGQGVVGQGGVGKEDKSVGLRKGPLRSTEVL